MSEIMTYNQDNFHDFERYAGIAVIRFYADWCAPCVQTKPIFKQLAEHMLPVLPTQPIKFGQVNIDQSPILTLRYQVFGLPSILIFQEGVIVKRMTGLLPLQQYIHSLEQLISTQVSTQI